jgi:hypothetical protein
VLDRIPYRYWPLPTRGSVDAADHSLAGLGLRLPEIEDRHAVGITHVVSDTDYFDLVCLLTKVMPRRPRPRLSF